MAKKMKEVKHMGKFRRLIALLIMVAMLMSNSALTLTAFAEDEGGGEGEEERVIDKSVYMDPDQPIEVRVEALLAQMTLEEKVGQTTQLERSNANGYQTMSGYIKDYYLGSILSGGGAVPSTNSFEGWIEMIYAYQTAALSTPLGIPILYEIDAVHGDGNVAGVTIFPHNVGLGAANDEELMAKIGAATAAEMRAVGHYGNFAPCIPTPQNIRWGRTYEGFGSDYDLNAKLGAAYTIGLQGGVPEDATALNTDDEHPNQFEFLNAPNTAFATMKHYFGEGIVFHNGTVNQGNAIIEDLPSDLSGMTPEELLENETIAQLLEPYAAMVEAGARSMMPSFSLINGIKMHQQKELIDLLKLPKEEGGLGFTGFVVADYRAHTQLNGSTQKIRNAQMINAGVDLAMVIQTSELTNQNTGWYPTTIQNVQEGAVSIERLDDAVRRILRVKFEMGLFENPMPDVSILQSEIRSGENLEVAREAVRKSLVMLKNDNDIVGSLKDMDNVMVTGRFANNMGYQCGGWTIAWQGVNGNSSGIVGTTFLEAAQRVVDNVGYSVDGTRNEGDTTDYEAVILCLGETPYAEGSGDASANGTGSRNTLQLDAADITALENAKRDFPDTPIVVMLFSGRPMIINNQIDDMDGLVVAWWPGSEGDGMADVLFGDYDFTGKTTFAWPWYSEWINDDSKEVMFEVGYGLKKGETGAELVAPQRQTSPYRVYEDGTRTNISSGSFSSVTNSISDGVPEVEPSPVKNRYGYLNPITLQSPTAANFGDANWVEYEIYVEADGSYSISLDYVATAAAQAGLTAEIDGEQAASYDLINTSGSTVKTDVSDIELTQGTHTLRVNYGGASITLKKIQINSSGTEEPDLNLNVLPITIAEGFAANVSVTADVDDNTTARLEYSGKTIANAAFENGEAKFTLSAEDIAAAGTYAVNIYDEYNTIIASDSIEVLAYEESLFNVTYSAASNNVFAEFGDDIEITDAFTITINGENAAFTVIDNKTIMFDLDYDGFNDVNEIVISDINFSRYFPSYSFTLNTEWDKSNDSSSVSEGLVELIDAEPAGSIVDLSKLPSYITKKLDTLTGSFTWLVEGYDWGPGVSKLYLALGNEVSASDIDADTFSVTANGRSRIVKDAYLSDADGNRTDAPSGTNVTIELDFVYTPGGSFGGSYDGSPFANSGMNVWADPYTQVITLNKPLDGYGYLSLTDNGKLTPEADKFDTSGKYYYMDSKYGLINLKYAEYTPEEEGTRPLVIWLHGAGEGGTDPTIVLYGNKVVNLASDDIQDIFGGAYVLTPQSPTMWMDGYNYNASDIKSAGQSIYTKALMALIEAYVADNPGIDTDRIYIGGCSNGGYMTMNMIMSYPDYFAAAYPICGAYKDIHITDEMIETIKDIPIWFTHSDADWLVRPADTTNPTYERLLAAGAENVHKSVYPNVVDSINGNVMMGHWSWIYTLNNDCTCDDENCEYADVTIMEWMAQQVKTETLTGSFTWLVEGFDWGPGVSKLYLELDEAVKLSDISADTFSVTANGKSRVIKDAYLAKADGSKSNALSSKYVTIELDFVYTQTGYADKYDYPFGSYDGNPFTYAGGRNNWTDPYTQVITLNKPVGGYGYISLADNGKLTPEIDKFDTTGKFTYEDITMSYASYDPELITSPEDPGFPLIIWLHGGGEGGTNPETALYANRAASFASDETQEIFGGAAYVLVPQCPTRWMDGYTSSAATLEAAGQSIYTDALMALIKDYVAANPQIDMSRIYIGGCSNGGYMAMNLLLEDPDYFAAAFPTCSPYQSAHITDEMLETIVDTPIWFTHSTVDSTVNIDTTTIPLYDRLVAAGATNVHKYTPDSVVDSMYGNNMNGHWSWINVYNNDDYCDETDCEYAGQGILNWMAKQVKEAPTLTGSFTWLVEGYDWGPGVSKLYLALDEAVNASDINADTFSVTANGAARVIKDVYLADANGNKTDAPSSQYVTIELDFVYTSYQPYANFGSYDGNPFTYTNRNNWTDPYTQVVTLNEPIGGYSRISLTDNGKLTPESDKFNTSGKYNYLDSKSGLITMSYASYKPSTNLADKKPLIIWLHGGGEGGTDPTTVLYANKAASFASDETQAIFDGAYVLVPQSPTMWLDGYNRNAPDAESAGQSMYTKALMALIKEYIAENPGIDTDRIYIGGCSAGGFMTMNMILTYPDYFAAAFPICPAYPSSHISDSALESIVDLPIWFTHSLDDPTVIYEPYVKDTYDRLIAAGSTKAHISTTENVVDSNGNLMNGHWSWIYVYKNEAFCDDADCEYEGLGVLEWLAKQAKEEEPNPSPSPTDPSPSPTDPSPSPTDPSPSPTAEVNIHNAYINGYNDGTFKADNSVTRAEVAKMLSDIGDIGTKPANVTFTDVKAGQWYYEAVTLLAGQGVINGYNDGTFRPDAPITRAEFVTMIIRCTGVSPSTGSTGFSDVPASHWAVGNIKASAEAGYVRGYNDGTFRPENALTRAEAVTVINRVLKREGSKDNIPADISIFPDVKRDHWAWADIVEAAVEHYYIVENGKEVWVNK